MTLPCNRLLSYLLIVYACVFTAHSQTSPVSIREQYMLRQLDNTSLQAHDRIAWADSLLSMTEHSAQENLIEEIYLKKGNIAYESAYYRTALDSYLEWLRLYGKKEDSQTSFEVMNNIAQIYYYIGLYNKSISLSLDILKRKKPNALNYLDVLAYERLAHCYIRLRDTNLTNKYTASADSCLKKLKITDPIYNRQVNFRLNILKAGVSVINADYGNINHHLAEAAKYSSGPADSISILGDEAIMYEIIKDPTISAKCYETIVNMRDTSYQSLVCINNYVHFLTSQGQYSKAHDMCKLSYDLLERMQLDHSKGNLLELESEIFMIEEDYKNAYLSLKKSREILDTLFSPDNLHYIYGLSNLTDIHWLQQSLDSSNKIKKNLWIGLVFLSLLTIALAIFLFMRHIKIRQERKENQKNIADLTNAYTQATERADNLRTQTERLLREMDGYKDSLNEIGKTFATIKDMEANNLSPNKINDKVLKLLEPLKLRFQGWDPIKTNLETIQGKLMANLVEKHSDITKSEITIAAFILLNIPTKEIAGIQSVSIRTVENTKYRLYKKLGVPVAEVPAYLRTFL